MLQMIIFLISEVVQIYVIYLMIHCLFKECRFGKVGEVAVYVGLYLVLTIPYLKFGVPMLTMLCSWSGIFLVTIAYRTTWKKRILAGVFVYGILMISESVVALLSGYVKLDLYETAEYFSVFGTICLPLVQFLVVLLIRNFIHLREGEEVTGIYWAISIALPVLSVYLLFVFYSQKEIDATQVISCAVVLFLINVFVFYLYDRQKEVLYIKHEKQSLELQNEYQLKQMNLMNQSVEISRRQKHDFLKHISMISFLTKQKRQDQLLEYLGDMQEVVEEQQSYVDTGNLMLDAIVNIKMQELILNEVEVKAHIAVPDNLDVSPYEMNIILSNLLDNCKEAVERMEDKHVFLNIECVKNRLFIETENSVEKVCYGENNKFQTIKKDKNNHGYGIRNIDEAVERCGGITNYTEENGKFKAKICIFL